MVTVKPGLVIYSSGPVTLGEVALTLDGSGDNEAGLVIYSPGPVTPGEVALTLKGGGE